MLPAVMAMTSASRQISGSSEPETEPDPHEQQL